MDGKTAASLTHAHVALKDRCCLQPDVTPTPQDITTPLPQQRIVLESDTQTSKLNKGKILFHEKEQFIFKNLFPFPSLKAQHG